MSNAIQTRQAQTLTMELGSGLTVSVQRGAPVSLSTAAALALCGAAHPTTDLDDTTISAYDIVLSNFHPEIIKAASVEVITRVKWFPKVYEIAEAARMITALITSSGMYATDDARRKRREEIRAWEADMLPRTAVFIQRAKADARLRAEIDAERRAGSQSRRQITAGG